MTASGSQRPAPTDRGSAAVTILVLLVLVVPATRCLPWRTDRRPAVEHRFAAVVEAAKRETREPLRLAPAGTVRAAEAAAVPSRARCACYLPFGMPRAPNAA